MPKRIAECTKAHLSGVPLPNYAATYTVISHQSVIDYVYNELTTAGFSVVSEEYRCTADGNIAQGIYKLNFNNDTELSMMFAWTNSYNKQVRFKCGVGAYINLTSTAMVCGDMGSWARKHTGTADEETIKTIQDQITNANMYYNQLVSDKESMKTITLNKRKQAQLLGILFAEYQILTTEQASIIRQQMDRPSHVYSDSNSLWAFYNYVTISLQHSHPKTWMEDQRVLHYFMSTMNNFQQCSAPAQVAPVVEIEEEDVIEASVTYVDPNQIDLEDLIAEVEAEEATLDVITYTDPVGNTFEAIDFHNAVVNEDPEDEEEEDLNDWMNLPLETPIEENLPKYTPDENQEYTGENSSYMSIEVSPEEKEQAELDIINEDSKENKKDSKTGSDFDIDLLFNLNDESDNNSTDFF